MDLLTAVFPLKVTSIHEYLERRYGASDVRRLASLTSSLSMVLYSGIVLYGAGTALASVTNIPDWSIVIGISSVAVFYKALGGLKAVVATDVIQGIIMLTATFAVVIKGTVEVGSVANIFALEEPSGRTKILDFDPDPMVRHTFWTLVIGGSISRLSLSFSQPAVQRLNSTSSRSEAKKVVLIAVPMYVILELIVVYEGPVAFAYFSHRGCDPLASGDISNPNQIVSYTVLGMFQSASGLQGLFLGALCNASLSTISLLLSGVLAVVSQDIIKHYMKGVSDSRLTRISKLLVLATGVVSCAIAIVIGQTKGKLTPIAVSVIGSVDAPLTAIFLMTAFVGCVTRKCVIIGAVCGLALGGWLSDGYNLSKGRKITPWLPLGPTDGCLNMIDTISRLSASTSSNIVYAQGDSMTSYFIGNISFQNTLIPHITDQVLYETKHVATGIDHLYSISYVYFPAIIMFFTILVVLLVSKLTQPKTPHEVPVDLILSFRRQFLCCFRKRDRTKEPMSMRIHISSPLSMYQ